MFPMDYSPKRSRVILNFDIETHFYDRVSVDKQLVYFLNGLELTKPFNIHVTMRNEAVTESAKDNKSDGTSKTRDYVCHKIMPIWLNKCAGYLSQLLSTFIMF